MNYARIVLIILSALVGPMGIAGFQYAGLTCCVIARYKIFAIVGRLPLVDLRSQYELMLPDTPSCWLIPPNPSGPSCSPGPRPLC